MGGIWDGAEIIDAYTRAQALADGQLIDVSALAHEHRFVSERVAVAITAGVQAVLEDLSARELRPRHVANPTREGAVRTRQYKLLWTFAVHARKAAPDADRVTFEFLVERGSTRAYDAVEMIGHIGPGDAGEPVITIMLPGED